MTFSLSYYHKLIVNLRSAGRTFSTVVAATEKSGAEVGRLCILRHDVDRIPRRSLAMSKIENQLGVKATYYFRCSKDGRFPTDYVEQIAALGHEVGYHFETLSQFQGNSTKAVEAFERNLAHFRSIAPCKSVSMHGAPLTRHNNQDLAKFVNFAGLGLIDAVYDLASLYPIYFTDTGGAWNVSGHRNRRDIVGELARSVPDFLRASELAAYSTDFPRPLYFNTHPERWPQSGAGSIQVGVTDTLTNIAKLVVRSVM